MIYIYLLIDPRNELPFYCGRTNEPKRRYREHIHEAKSYRQGNYHKEHKIRKIIESNNELIMNIVDECSLDTYRDAEKWWIDLIKACSFELANENNDGAGAPPGFRKNNSGENNPMHGKNHTKESKHLMSKNRTGLTSGENHPNWGKSHSEETRKKIGESNKGKTQSTEARKKNRMAHLGEKNHFYGKSHSPHSKKLMSLQTKMQHAMKNKNFRKLIDNLEQYYALTDTYPKRYVVAYG